MKKSKYEELLEKFFPKLYEAVFIEAQVAKKIAGINFCSPDYPKVFIKTNENENVLYGMIDTSPSMTIFLDSQNNQIKMNFVTIDQHKNIYRQDLKDEDIKSNLILTILSNWIYEIERPS